MSGDDITYWHYDDPMHDAQIVPADPGVTPGHIVVQAIGESWSIPFAVLTAPDGSQVFEQTGDAVPATIVDDTQDGSGALDG